MGRIIVSENVSVDGVMQDPTGDEGFAFGGWFARLSEPDSAAWAEVEFQEALDCSAWLIGRRSYTWFAERWGNRPGEWADRLRAVPKYVVSSTLTAATEWPNSVVLGGDAVEEAGKLRQNLDGDIHVYASAPLVQALLEHDLVDELRLMTHPFVLGGGARLFGGTSEPKPLRLAGVRPVGESLVLLSYQPLA